uniref:Uncharacterized protein n=1 Tax=Ciona savignyi TaxID=51511 RepID=H2YQE2_CIOSA
MQRDRLSERERLGDFHHKGEGGWIKPSLIDLPAPLVESGSNSVEKDIQKEREKTVLQEIFLSIDMVPDSPAEPDPEPYEMIPPKIIPTDDPNDPGPNAERSPSPINGDNVVLKNMLNNVMGNPQPQPTTPDLKDKLREILQAANANTASNGNTAIQEEQPPQNPQFQPPMQNGVDPNMMYPPPNMMNGGFYPMVPPPGMGGPNIPPPNMMGNEQYPMEWRGPPPQMGPRMGPQRPFPPQYAPNESWRPRKPWGGRRGGGEFRGRWQGDRGRYRR